MNFETILVFFFGTTFFVVLMYAALRKQPIHDERQFFLLRVVAAISGAACAAIVPGFLQMDIGLTAQIFIRAGGAIAVFALIYLINPPQIARSHPLESQAPHREIDEGLLNKLVNGSMRNLRSRVFYFDRMRGELYFIHSHRPESQNHYQNFSNHRQPYTSPEIPTDEDKFIKDMSHWAMSSGHQKSSSLCSCIERQDVLQYVLKENLIVVGSPKYNPVTKIIEDAACQNNWLHFRFEEETTACICDVPEEFKTVVTIKGVAGSPCADKTYRPDPIYPKPEEGTTLTDFGLLTRIPNPKGPANGGSPSYVIIVGGCRRAAQKALTEWLSQPATLHKLSNKYEDHAFQIVLSVKYKFSMDPEIIKDSMLEIDSSILRIKI